MSRRILCRWHEDRTPSMYLYPNGGYCFSCGKNATLEEIGREAPYAPEEREPEDLTPAIAYIESLPLRPWRGLEVPMDEDSAYILWPDRSFYKRRLLFNEKVRYLGPAGHKAPWLWARCEGGACIVVEGEVNALSVALACPNLAVVSPTGSGGFTKKNAQNSLTKVCSFDKVLIVADADAAGAKAIIELYGELAGRVPVIRTLLMPIDSNDVLTQHGKDELRKIIESAIEGPVAESPQDRKVPV